jgi:hypothetical protein
MAVWARLVSARTVLLLAAAVPCGFLATGCDDHVQITRDPDVRIAKHAAWAWRPSTPPSARGARPVVSRDVISRGDTVVRDRNGDNDIVRDRVRMAIQQTLTAKGLTQVSDPAAADFLVDYHFAVQRHNVTVREVYPGGAYPSIVCGPFSCWQGWGPPEIGYEHIRFREGTIVFDFVQQPTKHLVYRAIGERQVKRDTFSLTQDEINGLVNHLLKDLKTSKS